MDQAGIEYVRNMLDSENIRYFVKNEYLSMAAGEIPPQAGLREIWIIDDDDFARASEFVSAWRQPPGPRQAPWLCQECGEIHQGQFTSCWKCGKDRPAT